MISTELALKLRGAGLKWEPQRDDGYTFTPQVVKPVIKRPDSPDLITIEAGRYSLDNPCAVRRYTLLSPSQAVWLPSLDQLTEEIRKRGWEITTESADPVHPEVNLCRLGQAKRKSPDFYGNTSEEAAGTALLWLLETAQGSGPLKESHDPAAPFTGHEV